MPETVSEFLEAYRSGAARPTELIARTFQRIRDLSDPAIFISLREQAALAEAAALEQVGATSLPLYGIPIAVKDNIDVAGEPTTAACPAFAYTPTQDSTAVAKLKRAGAIIVGKTNLDQFATGLVGVRSPHGTPRNPFNPLLIPGGSSSGSAVAVSTGIVPLTLGTDTAGSGRVPAGMNNIVGLKPSGGLVSTAGVFPACRSLDCVSIFALTADDAFAALGVIAGPDPQDAWSRPLALGALGDVPPAIRIAIPRPDDLVFFGDTRAQAAFALGVKRAESLGATVAEIDLRPFIEAAKLLYEGPWVAERYAVVGDFIEKHGDKVHPITRKVIESGKWPSAVDAFRGIYRLKELRAQTARVMAQFDALMVPTVPAAYTIADIEANPIVLNSRLGTYTNFVNLLDFAAFSAPITLTEDGIPFGVTFIAPAGQDAHLVSLGRAVHALSGLPLGALKKNSPPPPPLGAKLREGEIALAVVGAHLSGMPLNGELRALGARFLEKTATTTDYKLFELPGSQPPKPGLLRVARGGGAAIELEIWALSAEAFGKFVDAVPPPLSIGSLDLRDGRQAKGFIVEAAAVAGARDISQFGGWRTFMSQSKEMV